LLDLLDFQFPESGFSIDFDRLPTWYERHKRRTAHDPTSARLYAPPLVIVPQTPGESRERPKAFLSREIAITFSKSNYGFSAAVDEFPFPDPNKLNAGDKARVMALAEALEKAETKPWDEIDNLVFGLYGLDEHDARVVRDTVEFCGPYQSVRQRAEEPVPRGELGVFCQYLEDMLQPLFEVARQKVVVRIAQQDSREWLPSWQFVSVSLAGDELHSTQRLLPRLMSDATKTGASRIIVRVPDGGLLVGILNARRFWTRSRARLCSLHIEQHHLDAFPIVTR
jgi:hypothetical protein